MNGRTEQVPNYFLIAANGFIKEYCNEQSNDNRTDEEKDGSTNTECCWKNKNKMNLKRHQKTCQH